MLNIAVLGLLSPSLGRLGLGRLPGDVRVRWRGREYYAPFTTTILLSALLTLLARFI
jgi:hypothetical protein